LSPSIPFPLFIAAEGSILENQQIVFPIGSVVRTHVTDKSGVKKNKTAILKLARSEIVLLSIKTDRNDRLVMTIYP
jgi:hypothetical protein